MRRTVPEVSGEGAVAMKLLKKLLTADEILAMGRADLLLMVAQLQFRFVNQRANMRCDETDEAQEAVTEALRIDKAVVEEVKILIAEEHGRPDFEGFAEALRTEAEGTATIHRADKTGQAASDVRSLRDLAQRVEAVGDRLGYCSLKETLT